jgi:hypothetical protein
MAVLGYSGVFAMLFALFVAALVVVTIKHQPERDDDSTVMPSAVGSDA